MTFAELTQRLKVGERMAQRRHDEISKARNLERAAEAYKMAVMVGATPGDCHEWLELLRAAFDLFECDQLFDMASDSTPPTDDLFGNPVGSLQARIAAAAFDAGMGK